MGVVGTYIIGCSFSYAILFGFFPAGVTGQYENCTGQLDAINDGRCDAENNIDECEFDGGDCCSCTCENDRLYPCGIWGYSCSNADAVDNAGDCQTHTSSYGPCQTDASQTWFVNDTASAASFADAVNCSGGTFEVLWQGSVLIHRTISISDGTTVNVTGEGLGAEVTGGGKKRLFTVESAVLHIEGLILSDGNATYGGAIAAISSNLSLIQTSCSDNIASSYGGAVYSGRGSTVAWDGQTTLVDNHGGRGGGAVTISASSTATWSGSTKFYNNTAAGDEGFGGAVYVNDHSRVSWHGVTYFIQNAASSNGGALYVDEDSTASWDGVTSFVQNTADFGGGVFVQQYSNVSWTAETSFTNNTASSNGGALFADEDSTASWDGVTSFIDNIADAGGAVFVEENSSVSWGGITSFVDNTADFGGGVFVQQYSNVSWTAETSFTNNTASSNGGALFADEDSTASWDGVTSFIDNTADAGGTIFVEENSSVSWGGMTSFVDNTADFGGGVFVQQYSDVSWTAETSFTNNTAGSNGGALFADEDSTVSWDGVTSFVDNTADAGGAVFVEENSSVSWGGMTSFVDNTADFGGGVFVQQYSDVSWTAETSFTNNTAGSNGGALFADEDSTVSWDGVTSFVDNTADFGGAVFVEENSSVSWGGMTSFVDNTADFGGGVFVQQYSDVSWTAETSFTNNTAGSNGGALFADEDSTVSWDGVTSFVDNTADFGGAVFVEEYSNVSWTSETTFSRNTAASYGGAFYVDENSIASWDGVTSFASNTADYGGAVSVNDNSVVSWTAESIFVKNYAWTGDGGALRVRFGSNALWTGETLFTENSANSSGGAVYVSKGANITIGGDTRFLDNDAAIDGGAIFVYVGYDQASLSYVLIDNGVAMILRGNNCGANGGGIAFIGAVVIRFSSNMTFFKNHAGVAGGAVYMSGVSFGPQFEGAKFYSNSAVVGGGVYATGSGTAAIGDEDEDLQQNPTIFRGCEFIGNWATTTGGAVNTGAGIDEIVNTSFVRNTAAIGGALRLVGTASLVGCEFIDNLSDEDEGPGIFNDGILSSVSSCSFVGNVFNCDPGSYLEYNETDALFATICKGCDILFRLLCNIEGKEPICLGELGHTRAVGGNNTIESLSIDPGFWRATNTSIHIFACYNTEACVGGFTGNEGYCSDGYEGPYCSVCRKGYTTSLGFACTKCSESITGGIALTVVLAVVFMFAIVSFISYMISGKSEDADKGIVARMTRYIPLQSIKAVIVVWQIITQFSTVANVVFPSVYQDFLDGVDVLNFDLSWVVSVGCIIDTDFHDQLFFATLGPLGGMAILGLTYIAAMRRTDASEDARRVIRRKHVSVVLLLTFLVYSSVSSTLFKMFACDDLDDGKIYLRADYRIECNASKHNALEIYAGFMIVLYVVGIPSFYGVLLFNNREALKTNAGREEDESIKPITDLWKPYRPDRFFYEVIECQRRVFLTGVLVFIYPNTAAQIAIALMMATFFVFVSEALAPHASLWDTWCSRTGHAIVFTSMFLALLLKVDVSGERASAQRAFEWVLVAAHACLVLIVVVEAFTMFIAWREEVTEDDRPRIRPSASISSSGVGERGRLPCRRRSSAVL